MYFIGVSTGGSSITKVFPRWAEALQLDAVLKGMDFSPDDASARYREAVEFIKSDPLSLGALVTTHKVNLLKATRDLFERLDPLAVALDEVSCISKRGAELCGHAKDPITVGCALREIIDDEYWRRSRGEMLILGAGGSSMALTLHLHNRANAGGDVPRKLIVTALDERGFEDIRKVHRRLGISIPTDYAVTPEPAAADRLVARLPDGSMVVNATGVGKDRPGSPLTDAVKFPRDGIAWDFNYRGDLAFLRQARSARGSHRLRVEDGSVYFIHGWMRVIAEVFAIDIPATGREFERLSRIAREAV
ncbi:MAG TPA: shikimate dehydrogenase [Roseiarcus sp.]|jgi:shikimate 5-dehydrogenase|nr:shikimate dehydrogenase [Roseiarcus sp.]